MKLSSSILIMVSVMVLGYVAAMLSAAEYHVSIDGSGDFTVIQEAIDAAVDGDTIIVHPGTHYENIRFEGKNIILRSTDPEDWDVVEATIIDGQQLGSVVEFSGTEDETCQLRGLTMTNGSATNGGGIFGGLEDGPHSMASIYNCIIYGNTASSGGGFCGCDGRIKGCWIAGNQASGGGALYDCRGEIVRCVISGNIGAYGGAIRACDGLFANCLICDNSAPRAGAIWANDRSPTIKNCTITGNIAERGGGLYEFNGKIFNSIIWGNWAPEGPDVYPDDSSFTSFSSCIGDWDGSGFGNISDDPLFVDAVEGDYHLSARSPCVDAGNNSYVVGLRDVEGGPRIANRIVDMGAYEYAVGCYVFVEPDKKVYATGETAKLSIHAGSSDFDQLVDVYAAFRVPGGQLFFIPSLSADMTPWIADVSLGPESTFVDTFEYELTDAAPDGNYIVYSALFVHGSTDSSALLTDLSQASFIYHKGEPTTLLVKQDGSGDFTTIQRAIDTALDGDVIVVYPGVYYENIEVSNKNLTLRSTDPGDLDVVERTVIGGAQNGSVITFYGRVDETCLLSGFTITNGQAQEGAGISGVRVVQDEIKARPTIKNCIVRDTGDGILACDGPIENCTVRDNGSGGIVNCDGAITNCLISGNYADRAGGGLSGCDGDIISCKILGNSAGQFGGGVYGCDGRILNCLISGNRTRDYGDMGIFGGGGISGCNCIIESCTISDNFSTCYGGGLYECGGTIANCVISGNEATYGGSALGRYYERFDGNLINCTLVDNSHRGAIGWFDGEFVNCVIWEDEGLPEEDEVSYSCIKNWTGGGEGNISDDPLFADPENRDYRLLPGSPCTNSGNNWAVNGQLDIAGMPRVIGSKVDMGAYEYPEGCFVSITADQDLYTGSDEMTLHLTAGAFGFTQLVDIYAAIAFRGRDLLFIPNWTSDWVPWFSGVELQEGPIFDESFIYPLVGTEPDGTSFVYAAAFPHDSSDLADPLTNVASCSFRYHRAGTAELHVTQDGTGDFETIQEAIDASLDGDTIIVHPGIYRENIDFLGKSIALRSIDPSDPRTVVSTVIHGLSDEPVVTLRWAEDGLCEISGLTITGGYTGITSDRSPRANVTISNCIVSGNGGGPLIYGGIHGCAGDIESCLIRNNYGCGIAYFSGTVRDCFVIGNGCTGLSHSAGEVFNCLITENTSPYGGGGICYYSGNITNCTIAGNSAAYGGGLGACDGRIQNCIIWGNNAPVGGEISSSSAITYCCVRDFAGGGEGNISDDPLFVTGPLGDYYLSSLTAGQDADSPCIDAGWGTPSDYGLERYTTRTDGTPDTGTVDMGFHYPTDEAQVDIEVSCSLNADGFAAGHHKPGAYSHISTLAPSASPYGFICTDSAQFNVN